MLGIIDALTDPRGHNHHLINHSFTEIQIKCGFDLSMQCGFIITATCSNGACAKTSEQHGLSIIGFLSH